MAGGPAELPRRTPFAAEPDPIFDRFATLVTRELGVPVGLVSFVDVDGQALPGAVGLPEPWASERWTPLTHSFCQHVVTTGLPLVVQNANDDELVSTNLAVMELGVIAYAGMPLRDGDGRVVGSMCAIDHTPRDWTDDQLDVLERIADAVTDEIGRRLADGGDEPGRFGRPDIGER